MRISPSTYFIRSAILADLEFRSKKDFAEDETVRIVEICGYDRCACAATHVKSAGEIGIIKFIGMIRY